MFSKMKRILYIVLIFISFNTNVFAKNERAKTDSGITFGVEWGYVATIQSGYHYNFFAPEGYRVDDFGNSFGHHANAETYISGMIWESSGIFLFI